VFAERGRNHFVKGVWSNPDDQSTDRPATIDIIISADIGIAESVLALRTATARRVVEAGIGRHHHIVLEAQVHIGRAGAVEKLFAMAIEAGTGMRLHRKYPLLLSS